MALQSARQETSQEEDRGDGERDSGLRFLCAVQESPKVTTTQITCLTPQPHERYCQLPRHVRWRRFAETRASSTFAPRLTVSREGMPVARPSLGALNTLANRLPELV